MKLWSSWDWDYTTVGWAIFILYFIVWEAYTGIRHENEMLTDHLRPIFHAAPITWWLAFGLWLWLGVHFLAPSWERGLLNAVWYRGS